ncbi:MAG TPA: Fic family protein [Bacteroidia bacterium]|jgi:Fic family protein|nr:Fic family protein [Bacteroidia bacterium]
MTYAEKRNHIDELKKTLDSFSPMSPENEKRFWKKVRLEWNYNSNHIEGNTLTYGETELLLIFDQTSGTHEMREYEEMKAHDVAIHMVKEWAKDKNRDLTEADIRELNRIILVKPYWKEAITNDGQATRRLIKVGEYKEHPNSVRLQNGEIFEYTSPLETPIKMNELMDFYRKCSASTEVHPVWLASMMHYKFVRIHPFDDGNGRVARLIMNYVLMKNEYPPILIKSAEKKNYLEALHQADVGNDQFFEFYLMEQLEYVLGLAIKAAKGQNVEEPSDIDKEVHIWKREILSEKQEVKENSFDVIEELFKSSFKKLFLLFIDRTKQFEELFNKMEITGWFNGGNFDHKGIESIEQGFAQRREEYIKRTVGIITHSLDQDIKDMSIYIALKGFKGKSPIIFDQYASLKIKLEKYTYQISIDNSVLLSKPYSQPLTDIEIQDILTESQKAILAELKEKSKV